MNLYESVFQDLKDDVDLEINLETKSSDLDTFDYIAFILSCEKIYETTIYDREAEFLSVLDIKYFLEFMDFLKFGISSQYIYNLIVDNLNVLSEIRSIYLEHIIKTRDEKIDNILN